MSTQLVVAFVSGAVLLIALLGIGLHILVRKDQRPVPPQAMYIFRVVLSLAGAAFAAILSGFLNIQAKLVSLTIQAGGALAVFVIIYRINPPELLAHGVGGQAQGGQVAERKVKALVNKLKNGETERDRSKAALGLGQIGEKARTALPELIEGLNDQAPEVREYCAQALERLGSDATRALIVALRHAKGAAFAGPTPTIPRQIPELKDVMGEEDVRTALVEIGADAVPALLDMLRIAAPAARPLVAGALARIGDLSSGGMVEQAVRSSDDDSRLNSAIALAENASPKSIPALVALLNDKVREVRVCAFSGLAKTGSEDAVAPLFEALKKEPDSNVRAVATEALGELGLKVNEAIPSLIELLSDKWLGVQMGSILALGKIGPRAVAASTALAAFAKNEDWTFRLQAVIALGKISSSTAVPALRTALRDQREEVRRAATEALQKIEGD